MAVKLSAAQSAALRTGTGRANTLASLVRLGLMDAAHKLTDAGLDIEAERIEQTDVPAETATVATEEDTSVTPAPPAGYEDVTLRVTEDNIFTALRKGDVIIGAEECGTVRSARMTIHNNGTAFIYFDNGVDNREVFGIPQTLTVRRRVSESVTFPVAWGELRIMIMTQTDYIIVSSYQGTARTLPYAEAHEQADIFMRGGWTLTDNGDGAFTFTDSPSDRTVTFTPAPVPLADWERELLATMDNMSVVTTSRAELDGMRRYRDSVNDDAEVSGEKGYDVNRAEATAYDSLRLDY